MGLLARRKNKKFSYTPRYYKNEGEGSPFEIKQKFDDYRVTLDTPNSLKGKFSSAWDEYRNNPKNTTNKRTLYIFVLLALAAFLYFKF